MKTGPPSGPVAGGGGSRAGARPSWKKRWAARGVLAVAAPALVLALLEVGLRLAGFGYPTSYFVAGETAGTWVDNPSFGRRFFPSGLLRVPPPIRVTVAKPPGTIRVLVFGESAAMGDPKPAFGVGRYLEVLLRERYPAARFEVIPVAMTAINSHALVAMARESTALKADFWIVYAGNNEMLGPFGAGTALGGSSWSVNWVRWVLVAKATRLGQAVESLAGRLWDSPTGSSRWEGIKVLAAEHVTGDSPLRTRVYDSFERNLGDVVRIGTASGARVLLSTVAVNLGDSGPFGSVFRPGVDPDRMAEVTRTLESARRSMTEPPRILDTAAARSAASVDPTHAGAQYLLGLALREESQGPPVLEAFGRARDLDTIPLRTDSRLNGITRRVAAARGCVLVDAEAGLARIANRGVPGREFFYEHVHLTPEGNHRLAELFGEGLSGLLPDSARAGAAGGWASPETCATRLALTPWARGASAELMLRRTLDAPFTNRLDQELQVEHLAQEISLQRRSQTPQAARFVAGVFTDAIAAAPEDPYLRRTYAEFLESTGDLKEAIAQWRQVVAWLPHHPFAYLQAGSLLRRVGEIEASRPLVEKAVAMQPDWVEARLELSEVLLSLKRPREAIAACEAALRLQPEHARAHLRLADAQAADGQREKAILNLEAAIRLDPRLWEARYLLGVELALAGQIAPAREQFEAVVRLKPDHARGQFNLGIALARQGSWPEAARHLAEALRLDPRNQSAREALAQVEAIQRQGTQPAPVEASATPEVPGPPAELSPLLAPPSPSPLSPLP
ncbi:MAG: tetratricopeptide repeat protein [Limisphaerales bacterium]